MIPNMFTIMAIAFHMKRSLGNHWIKLHEGVINKVHWDTSPMGIEWYDECMDMTVLSRVYGLREDNENEDLG